MTTSSLWWWRRNTTGQPKAARADCPRQMQVFVPNVPGGGIVGKPDYDKVWDRYSAAWNRLMLLPEKVWQFEATAARLIAAKRRYQTVENFTGVPWYVVAVIHEREASQDWKGNLANGDPWNRVTTHVPKGRGPFSSWESAAVDALKYEGLDKESNWCIEHSLYLLESYNGWGYWNHGVPSAYVWAGTAEYTSSKYTADGRWDPNAVDQQLGCAGLLFAMARQDPSITVRRQGDTGEPSVTTPRPVPVPPVPKPVAPVPVPAQPTWWRWLISLISKKG